MQDPKLLQKTSWRVLIIVENLPVPFDRRVWNEATALAREGYEVRIICPVGKGAEKKYENIDGVHIYRHPLPIEASGKFDYILEYLCSFYWELILTTRIFLLHGFDVIHACNPPDTTFLIGSFFKLLFGRKFVFDHHDLCPELYEAKRGRRGLLWRLMIILEYLTFTTADIVIATNESYRRIAIGRGRKSPNQVFVVRSGPNLERVQPGPAQEALRNGRRYLIGYVGVIGQQEGLQYLLEAAHHIVYTCGRLDVGFTIVGDGPALGDMRLLARRLKVDHVICFTGRVSDDELFAILSTADVCVNPDEFNELNDKSTMNKVVEYMAFGKPIVQFDVLEGRFSAQEASLYARPNDSVDLGKKILELLDCPERRAEMGAFGQARVYGELAWAHQAPKLLAAYRALEPA